MYNQAKKKVQNEFFPDRGLGKLRLAEAKKAISTFEKTTGDKERTLDLMMFYVEMGVEFTLAFGDIHDRFYESIESMYAKVTKECDENETYYNLFSQRLEQVIHQTMGIGWGFHDCLCDLYYSIGWVTEDEEE